VAVIGQTQIAYWRIQDNPAIFGTSLANGARIDTQSDPNLRQKALSLSLSFCQRSASTWPGSILSLIHPAAPGTICNRFFWKSTTSSAEPVWGARPGFMVCCKRR
jgi:hypothetical protein